MANETISFCCPACGVRLTVPAALAGVVGPCPSCRTQIQAPFPVAQVAAIPGMALAAAPVSTPAPPASAPAPAPVVAPREPGHGQSPAVLRPEPRQLPNRPAPVEVVAKQMPDPMPRDGRRHSSTDASPLPRHPRKKGLLARVAMLLIFVTLSVALVYGVLKVLKDQIQRESENMDRSQGRSAAAGGIISPGPEKPVPPEQATRGVADANGSIPTPEAPRTELTASAPPVPVELEAKSAGLEALAVLESFLAAKTLEERLPLIETKSPDAEVAASCLSRPLPPVREVVIDSQESNPVEGVVDYFYHVDFETEGNRANPQTLLVRIRGGSSPKVVVDPFLDLFGGRLAAYAAAPQEKGGRFQVIIYPVPSCTAEHVGDREKKMTLKLLARANTKEIAEAYFSRASKIGEMVKDGSYNLSIGTPKACTVLLRWNTEENAAHPFLEAIDIKRMDWNP
jgi:hypothetical protein